MSAEEYIKMMLGEQHFAIAVLKSQLDEAKKRIAELEKPKPE